MIAPAGSINIHGYLQVATDYEAASCIKLMRQNFRSHNASLIPLD